MAQFTRRTLERIEPRSVLKFSLLFCITVSLVLLLAGGVIYFVSARIGVIASVQDFIQSAGFPRFRLRAGTVFEVLAVLSLIGAVAWTAVSVLAAMIFNLVAETVGGIEITLRD